MRHLRVMRLRDPKRLSLAAGLALAILAAASLHYFTHDQSLSALTGGGLSNGLGQITLQADAVQVIGRDGGLPRWRMAAQTVTFSRDRRTVRIEHITQGLLLADSTHPGVSLTASHGSYETTFGSIGPGSAGGTLRLDGAVSATVLTRDRPRLKTEQILWDSMQNQIVCPGSLSATLPRLLVTAGNAVYSTLSNDTAHGTLRLGGSVHALFQSARGVAVLDCPGLLWSAAQNTAQTLGPVTAQIPGGLGVASADAITVDTRTGNLTGRNLRGTLRLAPGVQ